MREERAILREMLKVAAAWLRGRGRRTRKTTIHCHGGFRNKELAAHASRRKFSAWSFLSVALQGEFGPLAGPQTAAPRIVRRRVRRASGQVARPA